MRICRASVAILAWAAALMPLRAAPPDAADPIAAVVARAGAYVLEFERQLAGVVSEERYVQDVRARPGMGRIPGQIGPGGITHRELTSDLLLVRPTGASRWMQFRDVFEVDGRPVRDRSERLMKLFLAPSSSTSSQVEQIAEESSRYNIGNMDRTVNVPVLALAVIEPANQSRFRFKRVGRGDPRLGHGAGDALESAWVIAYQEVEPQTIIRTTNGRDMPARGRFWIQPDTGRVMASELVAADFAITGTIDVDYQPEAALGLLVPVAMRERYEIHRDGTRVDGVATYGRFRQFQVKVDEKLGTIKQ